MPCLPPKPRKVVRYCCRFCSKSNICCSMSDLAIFVQHCNWKRLFPHCGSGKLSSSNSIVTFPSLCHLCLLFCEGTRQLSNRGISRFHARGFMAFDFSPFGARAYRIICYLKFLGLVLRTDCCTPVISPTEERDVLGMAWLPRSIAS